MDEGEGGPNIAGAKTTFEILLPNLRRRPSGRAEKCTSKFLFVHELLADHRVTLPTRSPRNTRRAEAVTRARNLLWRLFGEPLSKDSLT